ncbi:hypothetical protein [Micromonospora sp. NPDC049679]|uniref:hypothetical protein n=1 Tax=Micromonospora sp. NPDC049679 TaxID=3155920 RepID=UPI00340289F2
MDALDQVAGPAVDLLTRVDDLLAGLGAPHDHPIWPLLRRLRALPGEAFGAIVALQPASLSAAGSALRGLLPRYADARATLTIRPSWEGAGAEAFDAQRTALVTHLDAGPESLAGRSASTASYLDGVADWATWSRDALARALAEVLGSAESVLIVAGAPADDRSARAAADIGARVLAVVMESVDRGEALLRQWGPALVELPYRSQPPGGSRPDVATRLAY